MDVGYFLPCKVLIYEDNETVKIGIISPEKLIGLLNYNDLETTAKEVQSILIEAINNAK